MKVSTFNIFEQHFFKENLLMNTEIMQFIHNINESIQHLKILKESNAFEINSFKKLNNINVHWLRKPGYFKEFSLGENSWILIGNMA